jgi:hypothetical protein
VQGVGSWGGEGGGVGSFCWGHIGGRLGWALLAGVGDARGQRTHFLWGFAGGARPGCQEGAGEHGDHSAEPSGGGWLPSRRVACLLGSFLHM